MKIAFLGKRWRFHVQENQKFHSNVLDYNLLTLFKHNLRVLALIDLKKVYTNVPIYQ